MSEPTPAKRGAFTRGAWEEARALVWQHRRRLALGLVLMLVNRLSGLVLPWSPKILIDQVIGAQRLDLLNVLVLAVGGATLVGALTSFALSQILGVAAQRAITDMRRSLQSHVARLPISYFDSTKTGILISRIMTDAEGIRNLVGTGLVQLLGGLVTATLALGVLFYLNWKLTAISILVLGTFAGVMALAFTRLRPLFRERGKINAEVTGRLAETLGGIRIVKAYRAEHSERLVFTRGRAPAVPQHRQDYDRHLRGRGVRIPDHRRHRNRHDAGRRPRGGERGDDARRLHFLSAVHRAHRGPADPGRLDRHPDHRGLRRTRPDP